MNLIKFLYTWLRRLPWKFTLSFFLMMLIWLFIVSAVLNFFALRTISDAILKLLLPSFLKQVEGTGFAGYLYAPIPVFFEGLVALIILFSGILLSYNFAGWFYRKYRHSIKIQAHDPVPPLPGSGKMFEEFMQKRGLKELRIGLILAGGGAKGAYQAGALKAIYEFLEQNNVLDKVKMISGTSIGSWNSMFWLAGLIKSPGNGQMSAHEKWWRSVEIKQVIEFADYLPLVKNYFLYSTPWRESFKAVFMDTGTVKKALMDNLFKNPEDSIHFYLTRSNVESGRLEFATNNSKLPKMTRTKWRGGSKAGTEAIVPRSDYELIEDKNNTDVLERLKVAVFASMDLPPLFPYMFIDREWFEDGGVVDNLPLRFATGIEQCNLLFVLPLNASFYASVDQKSVMKRLFRVMEVRQGVLERDSMKLTRLYNEKARLKNPKTPALVSVFAICPNQPLGIGTAEFWKTKEAGEAFDLMYSATKNELQENFLEATNPDWLRMALVSPLGEITYRDDF
ncbi:MAG: patatin-like phospholipase family protein [bacterium]